MGERLSFPCRLPRDGTGLRDDTSFGPETNPVPWQKVRPNRGLRKHKANIGNHGKLMGTFLGACPKRTMGKKSRGVPLPENSGLEWRAESRLPILHRVLKKFPRFTRVPTKKQSQIDKRKGILQISWLPMFPMFALCFLSCPRLGLTFRHWKASGLRLGFGSRFGGAGAAQIYQAAARWVRLGVGMVSACAVPVVPWRRTTRKCHCPSICTCLQSMTLKFS